ncbi:hypothetical protein NC652_041702 [Populus alba x Populus x berolinensis]|nr:hypothetical protein NC652_041702 [Populus alba x Populus x berolinensis]
MFGSEVFESINHYFQSRNSVQKPKFLVQYRSIMLPLLRYNHTICCSLRALLHVRNL